MQSKPRPPSTPASKPLSPVNRPTLADVAKVAGVSKITASRALGNPTIVSEATRLKVREAVAKTGYVPNLLAGGLKSARSRLVACLVPTISSGSAFILAVQSLTETLAASGYQVMLGQRGYGEQEEDALLDAVIGRRVDGIVLIGAMQTSSLRQRLRDTGIPVIEAWDMTRTPIDMLVGFSHEKIGAAVANYVHGKGYRKPTMIVAREPRSTARGHGFLKEARRLGYGDVPATRIDAPTRMRHGRQGAAELLRQHPDLDVIFCATDLVALGAITELHTQGKRVPDDVGIVGFGDLDFAVDAEPPLTTVQIDSIEIGRRAARMLVERIEGGPIADPVVDLGFTVMERASG